MDILTMLKNFLASFDFSDIVNRDNITLALAIFGSIGTLFSCLHTLIINRKNLHLRIVGHRITEKNRFFFLLYLKINPDFQSLLQESVSSIMMFSTLVP